MLLNLPPEERARVQIADALVFYLQNIETQRRGSTEEAIREAVQECSERLYFDLARAILLYKRMSKKVEVLA